MSLTKSEQEDLNMLLNITSSIHNSFIKLLNLEISGQKETEEYKSLISSTNSSKLLEDSIFKRLCSSVNKQELLKELLGSEGIALNNELDVAVSNNRDKLIKRRIAIKLINSSEKNNFAEYDIVIKQDFINTVLTILNIYINDTKLAKYSNELLYLKYNLAFLYEFVESDLIEHEFNINPTLYWCAQFHAELKHIGANFTTMSNLRMSTKIIDTNFEFLLKQNSYALNDRNNYVKSIISQILLRTSLMFVRKDIVDSLEEAVKQQIFVNTMMKSDCGAEEMILEVVNANDKDRELPQIINLGMGL